MSMKNDLINHINTKVSAPNMDHSSLIISGANTLDKAFQPHKNTEQIISLDDHLQKIRGNQLVVMKDLATQEQNKRAIDILNKKFEADSKALNEAGANLFTYGGTKLDGTEDTYIQDIMKDFEKQTGRKDFNIDDVIRNVNDRQLALSSDLKDRINQYSDYKYNKAKIDNKILDSNDINKLGEEYYPQFGMMGQDLNSFKTLFSNNSNKLEEILTDKAYKTVFKQLNSDRDLDTERKEELVKKQLEQSQNSENEQSNNNKQVAKKSKTNQQNNNTNANNKQQNQSQQSNIKTEEERRADLIKFQNELNNMNNGYIRSNDNVQKMIELMGTDPVKQQAVVSKVLKAVGMDKLGPDKLYKPESGKIVIAGNMVGITANEINRMRSNKLSNDPTIDNEFMTDLYSWAESGELLNFPLDKYEKEFRMMTPEGQEAFQVMKRFQYFESKKYDPLIDMSNEIAKKQEFSNQTIKNRNETLDPKYDKYLDQATKYSVEGSVLLRRDKTLEGQINDSKNGRYNLDNRELHNAGKDREILATNNILKNISSSDKSIQEQIYFIVTNDTVLEKRFEYYKEYGKKLSQIYKDPILKKELVRDIQIAISDTMEDIETEVAIEMPNPRRLAEMVVLVDSIWSKDSGYYSSNPADLYNMTLNLFNKLHPDNPVNILNIAKQDTSEE